MMERRTILQAIAATPLATLPAIAEPDEPLPDLVARWLAIRSEYNSLPDPDGNSETPAHDATMAEMTRLEAEICHTIPTTVSGVAAQIEFAVEDGLIGGIYTNNQDGDLFQHLLVGAKKLAA